jgi:hypothetical protein
MTKPTIITALPLALALATAGAAQARPAPVSVAAAPHPGALAHRTHPHLRTTEHIIIQHRPAPPPEHEEDPLATMHFE